MATSSASVENFVDTTTKWRLLGDAIQDALDAVGFTRTTDTGQVDWSTVSLPASNTSGGYEVRKFTDTLQSTKPIICRIDYHRQTTGTAAANMILYFTVGTSSSGAGAITGTTQIFGGTTVAFHQPAATGVSKPVWASGFMTSTQGSVALSIGATVGDDAGADAGTFVIQRTVDTSGDTNGDGFFTGYFPNNGTLTAFTSTNDNFYDFADIAWRGDSSTYNRNNAGTAGAQLIQPGTAIGVRGTTIYTQAWQALGRGRMENPLLDWMVYHWAAIPRPGVDFAVTRYGSSHTYRATGSCIRTHQSAAINSDWRLAIRWE